MQNSIFLSRALQKIVAEAGKKSQFAALRTSCEEAMGLSIVSISLTLIVNSSSNRRGSQAQWAASDCPNVTVRRITLSA